MKSGFVSHVSKGKNYRKEASRVLNSLDRLMWKLMPYAHSDKKTETLLRWYHRTEVLGKTLYRLTLPGNGASNSVCSNPGAMGAGQCIPVDSFGRTAPERIAEAREYCARMRKRLRELEESGTPKFVNSPTMWDLLPEAERRERLARIKEQEKAAHV